MPALEPACIEVIRPGFLTTVQDLGRTGYQRFGMPVGGAMDPIALCLANRLVGNADGAAALEITVKGPEILFVSDAIVALTGGDLSPMLNGKPARLWTAIWMSRGSTLSFGERESGARQYLAIAGGIDVPAVLGSRSTHLRSRTGGFSGRALAQGDIVSSGMPASRAARRIGESVPAKARPRYDRHPTLRVIPGPQDDGFAPEALETLVSSRYTISAESDRMGYRLTGPPLVHAAGADIISDATPLGALQVPQNQQPILLMADRQTTGGYPKIAVVITSDIPLAAQLMPGDTVGFSLTDLTGALNILREQRRWMDAAVPSSPTEAPR